MAAMAQRMFGLQVNLRHGLLQHRQKKEWIVAKAARAAWRSKNLALHGALGVGE